MLFKVTKVVITLALFFHCIEGFERVMVVAESNVTIDDSFVDDDEDNTNAIGSGDSHRNSSCVYENCFSLSLFNVLANLTSNVLINIITDVQLNSIIHIVDLANIAITGHNNPTVNCNNSGGLHFISCYNCTIEGITWEGCGARDIRDDHIVYPVLQLTNSSNITIQNCLFQQSMGQAVVLSGMSGDVNINYCNFLYNKQYEGHGTAIHYSSNSILRNSPLKFMISNCNFFHNGILRTQSIVYFSQPSTIQCESLYMHNSKFHHNKGVPIYLCDKQDLHISGNIKFSNNVAENGGAILISDHSNVIVHKSTILNFTKNHVNNNGGAIFLTNHSSIFFNKHPTSYQCHDSRSRLHNSLNDHYPTQLHTVVTFYGNTASKWGQDIYTYKSKIIVGNDVMVTVGANERYLRGRSAVLVAYRSTITFNGNSRVIFINNAAYSIGGAVYTVNSTVKFEGNSTAIFENNLATSNGGGMYIDDHSTISFEGNSTVTFNNNVANDGGAIYVKFYSIIKFGEYSTVIYNGNFANHDGGAVYIHNSCTISFEGNSTVTFINNNAINNGGAVYIDDYSIISFVGNSLVTFNNNKAISNGGAMYIYHSSTITFEENSSVTYNDNEADHENGGAMHIHDSCDIIFEGISTVTFYNNTAEGNGGAIFANQISTTTFKGNSMVTLHNNKADNNGGAVYMDHNSAAKYTENSTVMFNSNTGAFGGGVFSKYSSINTEGYSFVSFFNNTAFWNGGAIYMSDHSDLSFLNSSTIHLNYNIANVYGRAVFILLKGNSIKFESPDVCFKDNVTGSKQKPVYINMPKSCDSTCLLHSITTANKNFSQLTTSPRKLILYNQAIGISNDTDHNTYVMHNIMLGQDITFDACVLDYYDQPTEATQFLITGMNHQDYNMTGSKYITMSCNHKIQGIAIIGNLHSNSSFNYSLNISLYVSHVYESKVISIKLIVELSQCHPGFWYSSETHKCECYNTKNIISCFSSNSTIKRGYWFGRIKGQPTITSCPNDYCNFTCCEITNGIYHLSPVRANQCKPHRSGTACGDCEKGYSLSFDSPECVEENKCTVGQTVLVITLSLLYCIALVVAVFVMMYFKVTVGSLYAIIYYYSVVDILLSRISFGSNGLYTTVNIMSSLAKLTPQFLGQLCLVQNMSGIDQQFIHYVHPTVISLILIMIIMLARRSRRVSSFVSRGIIHFICFLLLLSYTSVATTSLLLMRPLKFTNVDNIYTYLSPDIEYFNGRHLVYGIVAIVFMIVFVVGFPLLLLLEPFLNSKINFIKIKPLLDQFQGCYKDKYRCFAGYYMLCRLVIILLVIVKISDDFINQYILISSCALMQLIHVLVQPYISTFLNVFDGIILQLIVIISGLSAVEFVDNYDETFVLVVAYLLAILPLASFVAIKLWFNINAMINAIKDCKVKYFHKYSALSPNDIEQPIEASEIGIIVDDNMRRNAIIVDV